MASVSTQPQFRYTQPPSKVLHLRNLPWECIEEELIELGKPFGKVVNTKCNVGANRNQAFIEFVSWMCCFSSCVLFFLSNEAADFSYKSYYRNLQADINQAIAMISYYASSSEPAQVRGKTVYLQYSNRQEIVNNKTAADVAGNVLLVTIEGADARLVSIDVLHLVSNCVWCMLYMLKMWLCGCWSFSFVIRFCFVRLWKYFWHGCKQSAGPYQGIIFDGSLVLLEKELVCVCFLSPFLRTASFFPILSLSSYIVVV